MSGKEDSVHKKPRMDDEKEAVEDIETLKIVSVTNFLFKSN